MQEPGQQAADVGGIADDGGRELAISLVAPAPDRRRDLPGPDGRQMAWHTSAAKAAEMAMETWVRVTAKKSLGAYEIFEATGTIPEPEWPEQSMRELLAIGFKGRIIDGPEHPVIQKLRGEI